MAAYEGEIFKNCSSGAFEMRYSEFEDCTFEGYDVSQGDFSGSRFIECSFVRCNLSMVLMRQVQLNTIAFNGCKIMGVNFYDCIDSLFVVKFSDCILDYSSFSRKKMVATSFVSCSMKQVDLSECDLTGADFSDSDLLQTRFNRTLLKKANFATSRNYAFDPENNSIAHAKFSRFGLEGLLQKYDIVID